MKLYIVRRRDNHEAVGIFWAHNVQEMWEQVDTHVCPPNPCEYKIISGCASLVWESGSGIPLGVKVDLPDEEPDEETDECPNEELLMRQMWFTEELLKYLGREEVIGWEGFDAARYHALERNYDRETGEWVGGKYIDPDEADFLKKLMIFLQKNPPGYAEEFEWSPDRPVLSYLLDDSIGRYFKYEGVEHALCVTRGKLDDLAEGYEIISMEDRIEQFERLLPVIKESWEAYAVSGKAKIDMEPLLFEWSADGWSSSPLCSSCNEGTKL